MQPEEILQKAEQIIKGKRAADYGDAYENHQRIAKLWSVILETDVTPEQVYQCMIAVKLARLIVTPAHEDSWLDICGYAALGGEANGRITNGAVRTEE
jgi:hypothetical protein